MENFDAGARNISPWDDFVSPRSAVPYLAFARVSVFTGPRQLHSRSGVLSATHGRPPTLVQGRPCRSSRLLKKSPFSPAQPRRAKTRLFPCCVLAWFRLSMYLRGYAAALLNSLRVRLQPFVTSSSHGFFGSTIVFQHAARFGKMPSNVVVALLNASPYYKSTTWYFACCRLARDKCVLARWGGRVRWTF